VGQSKFRCDLDVRGNSDNFYQLGILVDTDGHYSNPNLLDRYLMQPSILRAFGWRFALVLTKDWYHHPDDVLTRLEKLLQGQEEPEDLQPEEAELPESVALVSNQEAPPPRSIPPSVAAQPAPGPGTAKGGVPEPAQASDSASGTVRHFEFIGGASQKFWEISISGNSFTVRFGRIGTPGQSQTKGFADEATAQRAAEKLIAEKLKKNYVETKH